MSKLLLGNEKGSGLLEIIVMSSIALLIFQFSMQAFSNFKTVNKSHAIKINKSLLTDYINASADCEKTLTNIEYQCKIGSYVEIMSNSPTKQTLIKIPEGTNKELSKIGGHLIRAKCNNCNECDMGVQIDIEALRVNNDNVPVKDPITEISSWVQLYDKIPFKCAI